jgi:hypothetical protein
MLYVYYEEDSLKDSINNTYNQLYLKTVTKDVLWINASRKKCT